MADTVDTVVVHNGTRIYVQRLTNISDGTGESGVIKLDISALMGPNGRAPTYTKLREVAWSIQGFTSVRLFWDHTTDDEIVVLGTGYGYMSFADVGGLVDPRSTGGTGDVLLTTAGATSGNTYTITLVWELKD
jgi:hypothetical protein